MSIQIGGIKRYSDDYSHEGPNKKGRVEGKDHLSNLIDDVFVHIFKDFSLRDLFAFEQVSKRCQSLASLRWKQLYTEDSNLGIAWKFAIEVDPATPDAAKWCYLIPKIIQQFDAEIWEEADPDQLFERYSEVLKRFPRLGLYLTQAYAPQPERGVFSPGIKENAQNGDLLLEALCRFSIQKRKFETNINPKQRQIACEQVSATFPLVEKAIESRQESACRHTNVLAFLFQLHATPWDFSNVDAWLTAKGLAEEEGEAYEDLRGIDAFNLNWLDAVATAQTLHFF